MEFVKIESVLEPLGLKNPQLAALHPDCDLYTVLLYQPNARIAGNSHFVGNAQPEVEKARYLSFLRVAIDKGVSLAATPEYSCPWAALDEAINSGLFPSEQNIWAIACEGITLEGLNAFREHHRGGIQFIFESEFDGTGRNFVDPLCYLFSVRRESNPKELVKVIVVQFKTEPMGDRVDYFERDHLIRGSKIYKIANEGESISLITLICSDALVLTDRAAINEIHGRSVILHIQLNKDPRNAAFASYRRAAFSAIDSDTEVICLNWARNVFCQDTNPKDWANIGGSGVYLKSQNLETRDQRISSNHLLGLYFTYWKEYRTYAYFLNYLPGVYLFRNTKVWQRHGAPQQAGRTGPEMLSFLSWSESSNAWIDGNLRDQDGFNEALVQYEADLSALGRVRDTPINVERLLALSCGHATTTDWAKIEKLQSCLIDSGEHLRRISFAQDHFPTAVSARDYLLRPFGVLSSLIRNLTTFPVRISDLHGNCQLSFAANAEFSNLYPLEGPHPATVVYLGENPRAHDLEKTYKDMKASMVASRFDKERLVIWYRDSEGAVRVYDDRARPKADEDEKEHPAAINREQE